MQDNDLISRAAARDVINTWGRLATEDVRMDLLHHDLNALPAIDAVPVVRCKDCWKCGYDNCPMDDYFDSHPMEPDFYCAHGEPEEMRPRSTCGPEYCEIGGKDDE